MQEGRHGTQVELPSMSYLLEMDVGDPVTEGTFFHTPKLGGSNWKKLSLWCDLGYYIGGKKEVPRLPSVALGYRTSFEPLFLTCPRGDVKVRLSGLCPWGGCPHGHWTLFSPLLNHKQVFTELLSGQRS